MPIYEYRCPNGHVFELFQRMTESAPEGCVECGAGPVERVLYPVAVHFKGSGFYSTDYGRGNSRKTGKESDSGSGDSGSGDSGSGDSGDSGGKDKPAEPKKAAEAS